ncbi:helix-turn-helix transcriptional regulator [Acerihabitans sp. TG2]|uniref:helix-turn-helix transcriptional regulator n=1 Tax=Acerihabitans sp. TG2 TaxID=3096008 RepID=UPI002B23BA38|nr:helix-turn-helix transcriptional regulator [Acerihabitans sp. TG2]MEA9390052.1 helix-turn-helix transcriptional regulator [Acerihabitans sp. TG2]
MESKCMDFSVSEDAKFRSTSYDALIAFMEHSNEFWYIKDHEHRFIYINNYAIYYSGLPKGYNPEGKLDSECPAPWSEIADVIQANDKNVMDSQKVIPTLMTFVYGGKEQLIQPFMADVTPLIKNGTSIGVVGRAKRLEIYSMYHMENNRSPESLCFGNPTDLFTDREFDVVFFAMQSLSAKEIAKRLKVSPNTVSKYLQSVYEKIGVSALSQLIEFCRNQGYDKYVPHKFIITHPYMPL